MLSLIAKRRLPRYALLGAAILLAGCDSVNPYYDATKKHHRPDGFNNNYIDS